MHPDWQNDAEYKLEYEQFIKGSYHAIFFFFFFFIQKMVEKIQNINKENIH